MCLYYRFPSWQLHLYLIIKIIVKTSKYLNNPQNKSHKSIIFVYPFIIQLCYFDFEKFLTFSQIKKQNKFHSYINFQISKMQSHDSLIKIKLVHAFGSTCSQNYQNSIAVCDEEIGQPKIAFPAGKTLAKKYMDRQQMDFVHFSPNIQKIQCMHILPSKTHVAVAEKPIGATSQVIRIYNLRIKQQPNTIKIFHESEKNGIINCMAFSLTQPKFMCCLIGEPYNRLIYVDTSKNKSLAQSSFTLKDIQKITICPNNSHLICASGNNMLKLFKVQQYAFKPIDDIKKLSKGRKFTDHSWYKKKMLMVSTDRNQLLIIQENRNIYEVKQEYHNVFNEENIDNTFISAICPFSKGVILGNSIGKFCLWVRKQDANNYQQQENLQLVKKWGTTQERASKVTCISISNKQDLIVVSLANNDIATLYLSELLPQISDIISQFTVEKKFFFQYLYQGFHSAAITGMDLCLQRPLLATCSTQDSTIRIWNYRNFGCKLLRMFYYKVQDNPKNQKPLLTLSFHPSGYYLAVGCKDKLRIFHVLNSQLRPFRIIDARMAHIVKFSQGGHLLAVCTPSHQQLHGGDTLKIYNALTLEEIWTFKDCTNKICDLQWKNLDQSICIAAKNQVYEWKVFDWSKFKHITSIQDSYQALAYDTSKNSLVIFATHYNNYFLQQHSHQGGKPTKLPIDMKILKMIQVKTNKQKAFILALENGSIVVFSGVNEPLIMDYHNDHLSKINQIAISPCGKYLMTVGQDALLFIYEIFTMSSNGTITDQQSSTGAVDDFLADVVLLPKSEMQKYNQKQQQYSKVLNSMNIKLKQATNESSKRFKTKVQEIETQKNRVIEDLLYRIQRMNEQVDQMNRKNNEAIDNLDNQNAIDAENMERTYEDKLKFEQEKYFQLQQQIIQANLIHKKQLQRIKSEYDIKIQNMKKQLGNKFKQSQQIYSTSKMATEQATKIFDERFKQIEVEQQDEIRQIKQKKNQFKNQTAKELEALHKKLQQVKRKYDNLVFQKDQIQQSNQNMGYKRKKLIKEVQDAREKLKDMTTQLAEKIDTLNQKQKKIAQFEIKVTDLQKNKHVLSYKATQMRKAIDPKDVQIDRLKQDLIKLKKEFQSALQKKQKSVLLMEKLEKERQYVEKCFNNQTAQTKEKTSIIDQLLYQVHNCLKNSKGDPKIYHKELIKLYHKYVEKTERKNTTQDPTSIEQTTKQIVYLEKSLFQSNKTHEKILGRRNDEITKLTKENAELIHDLNEIKKQSKQLNLKIKAKKDQIQKLRSMKNQMINQCKNNNIKISHDEDLFSLDKSQKKMNAISTISQGQTSTIAVLDKKALSQKKQNQIISEIQFMNEKIHKLDFYLQQIKQKIRKHTLGYRCQGKPINQDDQLEIK